LFRIAVVQMRAHPLKIFAASYTYLNDGKMEFDHKSNNLMTMILMMQVLTAHGKKIRYDGFAYATVFVDASNDNMVQQRSQYRSIVV
jgi:hypothetical protein